MSALLIAEQVQIVIDVVTQQVCSSPTFENLLNHVGISLPDCRRGSQADGRTSSQQYLPLTFIPSKCWSTTRTASRRNALLTSHFNSQAFGPARANSSRARSKPAHAHWILLINALTELPPSG